MSRDLIKIPITATPLLQSCIHYRYFPSIGHYSTMALAPERQTNPERQHDVSVLSVR